eukprot:GFUD01074716.1.p1 GENE.GFUD01074716.1~~GFUD01074716.1.p1  ORF type:complete len:138 (+),score=37.25 GFUD01074716.1:201-614(+)
MDQFQSQGFITWIVKLTLKLVTLCIGIVTAQDDFGGDDAGADMDLESMMGGDSGAPADKEVEVEVEPKSFTEESILALQQLGLIIGVAFMVMFGFMVMVGVEKLVEKMGEKYQAMTGKKQPEEKDPASLVGTFSRYK